MFRRDPHILFPHDRILRYTFIPLVPKAITPNMITIFRIALTPFVLWLLFVGNFQIGTPLFLFAAFTDALDGSLARLRNQVTNWGTFFDPIADKILIGSVVLLVVIQYVNVILGLMIVIVEAFIVIGGLVRRHNGEVISANIFGKIKMVLQVVGISLLLIALWMGVDLFMPISVGVLALGLIFAIISLFTYGL